VVTSTLEDLDPDCLRLKMLDLITSYDYAPVYVWSPEARQQYMQWYDQLQLIKTREK
jgi:hypothetical protein